MEASCLVFVLRRNDSHRRLRHIIKTVIDQLAICGLNLVAAISDQGSTNRAAVNQLILDTRRSLEGSPRSNYPDPGVLVYEVNNCEVVHLNDFPHLIKCICNLLGNDLHFVQRGIHKKASWCHVLRLYEMDKARGPFSQLVKLIDEHVLPSKIKKMKVKNCTQVFSHTVATAMQLEPVLNYPQIQNFTWIPKCVKQQIF
jgi:hypothetical protein